MLTTPAVRSRSLLPTALLLLTAAACGPPAAVVTTGAPPAPVVITDGAGVLRAMHDRYAGKWFSTLAFAQNTTTISASGRVTRGVWNEYIAVPGRLRIDYQPLSDYSGVLYTDGKVYSFVNGRQTAAQNGWNPLLVLIADVYAQPVDTTARQLDSLGFNLSALHRTTSDGKPVWVVGATAGDTTMSQFWVDVDSLLIRRVIQRTTNGARTTVTDIRFAKYSDVSGYPVAFDVSFYRDGRLYFREEYFNVRANVPIPAPVFDPQQWKASQIVGGGE